MLLIVSENIDVSTNEVINWLNYYKIPHCRINNSSEILFQYTTIENGETDWEISIKENHVTELKIITNKEITAYWYRRGSLNIPLSFPASIFYKEDSFISALTEHLTYNQKELIILLHNSLKTKKYIGCYNDNFITKLQMLQIAQQADLYTPFTAIVSNKKQLADFIEKHQTIITKGIKSNSFNINSYTPVTSLTQIIKKNDFDLFPDQFAPSIVQKYIDKLFELRVFYLAENCYTAAIFSQKDEKTKVDFRNYNSEKPNRIIPYKLPYDIEQRLIKLMNSLKMKSGSIDIIVSTQLEYFFLEVNPVGQFEWISKNCNFYLEKIIANYFKQNTHESKSYSIS